MGRPWRCFSGHSGEDDLPLGACPACGLPVSFDPLPAARPAEQPAPPPVLAAPDGSLSPDLTADLLASRTDDARPFADAGAIPVDIALNLPLVPATAPPAPETPVVDLAPLRSGRGQLRSRILPPIVEANPGRSAGTTRTVPARRWRPMATALLLLAIVVPVAITTFSVATALRLARAHEQMRRERDQAAVAAPPAKLVVARGVPAEPGEPPPLPRPAPEQIRVAPVPETEPPPPPAPEVESPPAALALMNRAAEREQQGDLTAARAACDQAATLLERALAAHPEHDDTRHDLGRVLTRRASLQVRQEGAWSAAAADAGAYLKQAVADGERAVRLLTPLTSRRPEDVALATDLAAASSGLGLARALRGENDLARTVYEQAITHFHDLYRRAPELDDHQYLLAVARGNLGLHRLRQGEGDAGRAALRTCRGELEALRTMTPDRPLYTLELARLAAGEGLAAATSGDLSAAAAAFASAVELLESVHERFPGRADIRRELLVTYASALSCQEELARSSDADAAPLVAALGRLHAGYEQAIAADRVRRWIDRAVFVVTLDDLAGDRRARGDRAGAAAANDLARRLTGTRR